MNESKGDNTRKIFRNCTLVGAPFSPCVTDGMWFVSHWDVIETNTNKSAVYVFGVGGNEMTLYNERQTDLSLEELVMDTLTSHMERHGFQAKLFRFEFDGDRFELCEEEPKWAHYDCGRIDKK